MIQSLTPRPLMLFVLAGLVLAAAHLGHAQVPSAESKPNILFISVDDLNDWVGFMNGHPGMTIQTPNLDRLAASSMIFTNAHTPAPACAPTRAAILSGVHHARSGAENVYWGDEPRWREFEALRDVETLEQFFKNRGYKTLGAGKIYHSQAPPWSPTSQVEPANWDFYYPSAYISHPFQIRAPEDVIYPADVDNTTRPGGERGWWTWGPVPVEDDKMADYHVVDWARYQLGQEHDRPFFLAVGTWKPHDPWEVPQKYFDIYPLDEIVLPEVKDDDLEDAFDHGRRWIHQWAVDNRQWEKVVQSYAASITFADAQIGRLLDAFENSQHADDTIVMLWSDHGMHMGEKENIEKFTLWEESTRVPLIVSVPGVTRPGTSSDQPVSLMDLYPTLVDLAGFDPPSHLDGRSLVPQLEDPERATPPVVTSYQFTWTDEPVIGHTVRSERYRYIYYPEINLEELYDHDVDPSEWDNVAYQPANQAIVREHRQVLLGMLPDLTWDAGEPEGYAVDGDGNIRKIGYRSY
jgi:arylsulfatase A-like enzyme|tara:strand:+ start:620 stop:2179 length:1560 start_codon:yes stop_codon:yes gene_type:complete